MKTTKHIYLLDTQGDANWLSTLTRREMPFRCFQPL
ncbi:hypothetical protein F441_06824 [Phytophthora nicotianae CJ01A1]|uniref:Uncharacterized protein n=5 Tax=Phytophthora nicotianae TaxID=4792 RepID=W2RDK9_PHYN3|nr:hypothetical protein PPTG_20985 [Phytophthora nicotianae INRA-310]ETI49273.1 hypothetical protein F443_06820 [Phytophthora nicotianae P1569]ETK89164.1 hypothetical protein L915_06690 [Phytophthora nicotianae]ETP19073.1 hypothetical protein F441_06824 [Phytophthora nicotianae CJ01A1]ETP47018.1 hypothetical protein F442_06856 [Phytophthora nicotianae P10297]ETL42574.1 hypothetical protein L916_06629 [Phytophthora nicotianae]